MSTERRKKSPEWPILLMIVTLNNCDSGHRFTHYGRAGAVCSHPSPTTWKEENFKEGNVSRLLVKLISIGFVSTQNMIQGVVR